MTIGPEKPRIAGTAKPSAISVWLHWIVAAAVLVALGSAIQAVYNSPMCCSGQKRYYFLLHAYAGLLVLGLVVARLIFRALFAWPRTSERTPRILNWAASLTQWSLYALLVLIPLTGWIMASSAGCCIGVPGLPDINELALQTNPARPADPAVAYSLHRVLPWLLLALILLHVMAGLLHHLVARDETLTRMLPGPVRRRASRTGSSPGRMAEQQPGGGQT